ncbi:MAG: MotA/TolQ/ExbB proton channel family protein [Planctomycetota bacterium]
MSSIKSSKVAIVLLCVMLLVVGTAITQSNATAQSPSVAAGSQAGAASNGAPSAEAPTRPVQGRSLFGIIIAGGPLMIPIGICSFILVLFTLERLVSLRRSQIVPAPFVNRFMDQLSSGELNRETALALCDKSNSTVSRIFRAGVQKWGRSAVEVEQAILDAGERAAWDLRRFLRGINGIATVSPLLGLFGTVVGMIQSFDSIAVVDSTMADQKALIATGISVALITTAAGLTVAIPALVSHLLITGIVDRRIMELDSLGMKVVNLVSAEALGLEAARSKGKAKAA